VTEGGGEGEGGGGGDGLFWCWVVWEQPQCLAVSRWRPAAMG
jgi:hypothetical protein